MEFSGIQKYLEKYKVKISNEEEKKSTVLAIIKDITGVLLEQSAIVIERGILAIKTDQTTKNEIYIRQKKILECLKEKNISVSELKF
jgi:hypothetical protein